MQTNKSSLPHVSPRLVDSLTDKEQCKGLGAVDLSVESPLIVSVCQAKPSSFSRMETSMWVACKMHRKKQMACAAGLALMAVLTCRILYEY